MHTMACLTCWFLSWIRKNKNEELCSWRMIDFLPTPNPLLFSKFATWASWHPIVGGPHRQNSIQRKVRRSQQSAHNGRMMKNPTSYFNDSPRLFLHFPFTNCHGWAGRWELVFRQEFTFSPGSWLFCIKHLSFLPAFAPWSLPLSDEHLNLSW